MLLSEFGDLGQPRLNVLALLTQFGLVFDQIFLQLLLLVLRLLLLVALFPQRGDTLVQRQDLLADQRFLALAFFDVLLLTRRGVFFLRLQLHQRALLLGHLQIEFGEKIRQMRLFLHITLAFAVDRAQLFCRNAGVQTLQLGLCLDSV